jgi:hypothetical protein
MHRTAVEHDHEWVETNPECEMLAAAAAGVCTTLREQGEEQNKTRTFIDSTC